MTQRRSQGARALRSGVLAALGVGLVGGGASVVAAQRLEFPPSVPHDAREARWPEEQYPRGPYITPDQFEDWVIQARVNLRSYSDNRSVNETFRLRYEVLEFENLTVDWPIFRRGASHLVAHDAVRLDYKVDGFRPPNRTEILIGPGTPAATVQPQPAEGFTPPVLFQSGSMVARYTGPGLEGVRTIEVNVDIPVRTWETVYHEKQANRVPWPEGPWPHEAMATFVPQAYIDATPRGEPLDMTPVESLVARWLDGNEPTDTTPALLAKYLAGRVQEHVQVNSIPFVTVGSTSAGITSGFVAGLNVGTPAETADSGMGTPWDLVNLLCAVYRSVGIPARTVFAARDADREVQEIGQSSLAPVYAWVEWCLFDEANKTVNWVPVDIIAIRENSSRAYALDQPWDFFGSHRHLDEYVPFAAQMLPPTPATAYGAPGFIGMLIPEGRGPGVLYSDVRFTVTEHPRTSRGTPAGRAFARERW